MKVLANLIWFSVVTLKPELVMNLLPFTLGVMAGILMGIFLMCLLIMAGRGPKPPEN